MQTKQQQWAEKAYESVLSKKAKTKEEKKKRKITEGFARASRLYYIRRVCAKHWPLPMLKCIPTI